MRILITGGSGWLGKSSINHIRKHIPRAEIKILGSHSRNMEILGEQFTVENLDQYDPKSFSPDGVIHLAHLTRGRIDEFGLQEYKFQNQKILSKLKTIFEVNQIKWTTVVSSGAVESFVGKIENNPYTESKLAEEKFIREYSISNNIGFSIVRLWGSLGFDMPINRNYAVSDFIIQALEKDEIKVKAINKVFRRYVDSREFMSVCIESARVKINDTFSSGGQLIEISDLAREIGFRMNSAVTVPDVQVETSDEYFPSDFNYENIRKLCNVPKIDFFDSLEATIVSHKSQFSH